MNKKACSFIVLTVFTIVFCRYEVEEAIILPTIVILLLSLAFEFVWFKKLKNKPFALTLLFLLFILPYKYVEIGLFQLTSGFKANLIHYLHVFPVTYGLLIIPCVDIIVGIGYIKKSRN